MPGIASLDQLQTLLRNQGVRTAYVKRLALKQDNEKNQILLAGGLDGVTNLFPARIEAGRSSESVGKRNSQPGQPKLHARLDFAWLGENGERHDAPGTSIIDYFQYPEVRMSGFMNRCAHAPDALRRDHMAAYGQRILVMGTASDGKVLGLVLTERDDPLVPNFPDLPQATSGALLRVLIIDGRVGADPAQLLREELEAIVHGGWHASRINRGGVISPFKGAQGGGYTLEALLGVAANGDKKPDRHGFEIKSYSGDRVSLMTPTPDLGFQGENSFRDFMERYGRAGIRDATTRRFTGQHRAGVINKATGLTLRVRGYDRAADLFAEADDVAVELWNPVTGEVVAGWSLEKMANCWNAKHANALYITFEKRDGNDGTEYRYSRSWVQGRGTDVSRLLRAIDQGVVFYDPADSIYADGKPKVRSQWRVNANALPGAMRQLYAETETITV